jgi:hypothetical protein
MIMTNPNAIPTPEGHRGDGTVSEYTGRLVTGNTVEDANTFAHLFDPNAPDPGEAPADPLDPWAAIQTPGRAAAVPAAAKNVDSTGMPPAARTSDRPGYWVQHMNKIPEASKYYPPGR